MYKDKLLNMNILLAIPALATSFLQSPKIEDYVQSNFNDASFTAKVKFGNQTELRKINKDFGESYRFGSTDFRMKEPFKLRGDAKVEDTAVVFILNGGTRVIRAPRQHINLKTNVANKPGQRQTPFDFGILTKALVNDYLEGKFIRKDRATDDLVFDLTYNSKFDDSSRYRVWIDPSTHFMSKREWYDQSGNLKATFIYSGPQKISGCTLPSSAVVKNADGKAAGETMYQNIKVNTGLPDSIFNP